MRAMLTARQSLVLISLFFIGCAEPSEAPVTPNAAPGPDLAAAPTPPPPTVSAPILADAAPAPNASAHDADDAEGVRRWVSWNGPTAGSVVATPKAWAIAPNTLGVTADDKPSFSSVMLRVAEVVSSSDKETVLREKWGRFAVPAALVRPAQPTPGLKRGSVARCSFGGNSVVGRIETADAKSATCAFLFMEKPRKEKLAPEEVLPLDGSLQMGAPVHARFPSEEGWYEGFVVAAADADAWVSIDTQFAKGHPRAGKSVHKLAASDVRALDLKPLKVGEACLASDLGGVAPCKIKKVLSGGLGYSVAFDSGSTKDLEFDRVARAPKPE